MQRGQDTTGALNLAADRAAWRAMLRSGEAPDGFRRAPAPMLPMPIAMTRPARAAAVRTNAAMDRLVRRSRVIELSPA